VNHAGYGVEFSPDNVLNGRLIYFSTYEDILYQDGFSEGEGSSEIGKVMRIRQANVGTDSTIIIGQGDIQQTTDSSSLLIPFPVSGSIWNLQLAPDNKIYVCSNSSSWPASNIKLGVIRYPNIQGTGCAFDINGLPLAPNTSHEMTLPQWVHKTNSLSTNPCP
jgi:hypothetical protein